MVYGTRPEAAKCWPLVQELRRRGIVPHLFCTGQHTTLLQDGLGAKLAFQAGYVNLRTPAVGNPYDYPKALDKALRWRLEHLEPDWVLVQGDTASAYAGAVLAATLTLRIGHIEAGIRSGDRMDPWPEEGFRSAIDGLSEAHFCATPANLRHITEEHPAAQPLLTGNTGIDTLLASVGHQTRPKADRCLVTLHRRETLESGRVLDVLKGLTQACRLRRTLHFVWPVHPNPLLAEALRTLNPPDNLELIPPLPHATFTDLLAHSRCVLTDSGGVQEEAAALGIPAAIARNVTDRPESVDLGLAKLAGTSVDGVREAIQWAAEATIQPSLCFGDGHASERIADYLVGAEPEPF